MYNYTWGSKLLLGKQFTWQAKSYLAITYFYWGPSQKFTWQAKYYLDLTLLLATLKRMPENPKFDPRSRIVIHIKYWFVVVKIFMYFFFDT